MKPNIFKSRKFWLAILDAFISTLAIVLALFFRPDVVSTVMLVIGLWQPVLVALIIGIAVEDSAAIRSNLYNPNKDTHLFP